MSNFFRFIVSWIKEKSQFLVFCGIFITLLFFSFGAGYFAGSGREVPIIIEKCGE